MSEADHILVSTFGRNESYSPLISPDEERRLRLVGAIYENLTRTAELGSKATFSLLASLALIGLCLASAKPQSVQVLGFTIQADHWLKLAIPLAMVVAYSILQLTLFWTLEMNRYRYAALPLRAIVLDDLARESERNLGAAWGLINEGLHGPDETAVLANESYLELVANNEVRMSALEEESRTITADVQSGRLGTDDWLRHEARIRSDLEALREHQSTERETLEEKMATARNILREQAVERAAKLEEANAKNEQLNKIGRSVRRATQLNVALALCGLVVPLLVSVFAFIVLFHMAV